MITTHVLDLARGMPAAGVRVRLARVDGAARQPVGSGATDSDGRLRSLVGQGVVVEAGVYELVFETGSYFAAHGVDAFHPTVQVTFEIRNAERHHHVPLLISPFGYTTYRGS
jgi:5-hydroxyisourate hydrolase